MTASIVAKFEHDCDRCKFIGRAQYNGYECDFYSCMSGTGSGFRSIIARFSNVPKDNFSGGFLECVHLTRIDWAFLGFSSAAIQLTNKEKTTLMRHVNKMPHEDKIKLIETLLNPIEDGE